MDMLDLKKKIGKFPQAPGVYVFYGAKKEILYIGKATNLKSRVGSYFKNVIPSGVEESRAGSSRRFAPQDDKIKIASRPIEMMMHKVADVEIQQTDSVLEALILESNLIKKHQPKYNIELKDDKSFSYFVVTEEEFPRIIILRKTDFKKYVILSKAKNLEKGSDSDIKNGILHYVQDDEKKSKAKKLKPEKLKAIFGPYVSKYQMEIALKIIRRIFPFHSNKAKTEKGCLDFQLGRCPGPYAGAISKKDYAKNIRGIKMILEGKKKRLITTLEKEMREVARKNEFEKAAELRNKIFALQHIRDIALMSKDFGEDESGIGNQESGRIRIEAYDISNISGKQAVGSMVVFENGVPSKSQYRKFKIKTVEGPDDVAMMREVLSRRFKNDWSMPELILLDGGVGHVNMAKQLLYRDLGLDVVIAGVAKGSSRKNLDLRTDANLRMDSNLRIKKILEDKNLVKQIMDEAHRFAISYHRKLRRKSALAD